MGLESMTRYVSPINPAVFPQLTVVLLGIGIFFMAWFFVYEVSIKTVLVLIVRQGERARGSKGCAVYAVPCT